MTSQLTTSSNLLKSSLNVLLVFFFYFVCFSFSFFLYREKKKAQNNEIIQLTLSHGVYMYSQAFENCTQLTLQKNYSLYTFSFCIV